MALLIASVRPLTVPVRSSVPSLAVSVPALAIDMLTVPEPVTLVFAAMVPRPLIVPPASVMPFRIGQPDAGCVQLHRIGADRQRLVTVRRRGGVDLQRPGRAEEGHGRGTAGAVELQRVAGNAADPQQGRRW